MNTSTLPHFIYKFSLVALLMLLVVNSIQAQWGWNWGSGRHYNFEQIDSVVSIPGKERKNGIHIGNDYYYLRFKLLGITLEIEEDWRIYENYDWKNYKVKYRSVEYQQQHDHGRLKSLNFEYGFAYFLTNGKFPSSSELFRVKPSSTYVGIMWNSTSYIHDLFYIDWGVGLNWLNYKFDNPATRLDPSGGQLNFFEATNISPIKSKLKITYLNFNVVPLIDFNRGRRQVRTITEDNIHRVTFSRKRGFRIGLGGYLSYRLSQKAKYVYWRNGSRKKDKEKSGLFLNDFRYGARLQIGIHGFDMFVNYDLSELFEDGRGPELNPVSIGIIF